MNQPKLYVITRNDLPAGHQATQSAHAAFAFAVAYPDLTALWHRESKFLILLSVPDEAALEALANRVEAARITQVAWREPDWSDTLTALAIAPDPMTSRLLANYPLTLRSSRVAEVPLGDYPALTPERDPAGREDSPVMA